MTRVVDVEHAVRKVTRNADQGQKTRQGNQVGPDLPQQRKNAVAELVDAFTLFPCNDFAANACVAGVFQAADVGSAADDNGDLGHQLAGFDPAKEIDQGRAASRNQHPQPDGTIEGPGKRSDPLNFRRFSHLRDSNFQKRRPQCVQL